MDSSQVLILILIVGILFIFFMNFGKQSQFLETYMSDPLDRSSLQSRDSPPRIAEMNAVKSDSYNSNSTFRDENKGSLEEYNFRPNYNPKSVPPRCGMNSKDYLIQYDLQDNYKNNPYAYPTKYSYTTALYRLQNIYDPHRYIEGEI